MEQPRLGRAVGFERAVVVEVVARQVGEHGGVEVHARDALLVERVRRHFERERRGAVVACCGETALHGDGVGRGQPGVLHACRMTVTQRADVPAATAEKIRRLRQQEGSRGLAVGAGDAGDAQVGRRAAEEAVRQLADVTTEVRDGDGSDAFGQHRRLEGGPRLPQHGDCAALDRCRRVREAVRRAPGTRQEHAARRRGRLSCTRSVTCRPCGAATSRPSSRRPSVML